MAKCPDDTNGDGDCGKYLCPHCGEYWRNDSAVVEALRELAARIGPQVEINPDSPTQTIAVKGMMLRTLAGSAIHGTSLGEQSDRDEMGVCVEPMETVIGLRRFDQYAYRTQPQGVISGPGDLDLTVYGLRKYAALAAQGNPTILALLFTRDEHTLYANEFGHELRERRGMFLSRQAGARFRGYLESQRRGLMGLRSGGTRNQGRSDIREKYGFDTKFAAHMVRLGLQGVELLNTGEISLPVPEPDRTWLLELRRGEHTKDEALYIAANLEEQIDILMRERGGALPDEPDWDAINDWLASVHHRYWGWES